jgi:hypothetical protein
MGAESAVETTLNGISHPSFRSARRDRLAALDQALDILETAHQNDITVVTPAMWAMLRPVFPAATVGETIFDVIEQVFDAQEPFMVPVEIEVPPRRRRVSLVVPFGLDGREEPRTTTPIIYRSSPFRRTAPAA